MTVQRANRSLILGIGSLVLGTACSNCLAQEASRIWVDQTGQHSVQAMLMRVDEERVVLIRRDGKEIELDLETLSDVDQDYVRDYTAQVLGRNDLRTQPPHAPEIDPLGLLELPQVDATEIDEDAFGSSKFLELGTHRSMVRRIVLPGKLAADRATTQLGCPEANIPIRDLDFNDSVSKPVPILALDRWQTRTTSVGLSISGRSLLPGQVSRQQLMRFDLADSRGIVALQHDQGIRLLDHDSDRGQSLVMTDFNSTGGGGSLALATGWQGDNVQLNTIRPLPTGSTTRSAPRIHWARLVDQQHVVAMVDQSIVLWNLVSGNPVYRIDGMSTKCVPALSGGRRYLAIPSEGAVDLYATATGKSLGQIKVERQVPGVQFSHHGNALAIVTPRRLRVWNLVDAALDSDVESRESLGTKNPVWVDHDLILTGNGILVSCFRSMPVWKYDLAGCEIVSVGKHVAILHKTPTAQLVTTRLPHESARQMIRRIDASPLDTESKSGRTPGRSQWNGNDWVDREVRFSALQNRRR